MNKCTNCNQEFEGNFCPNCGTKREEEKTCPICNAILKESVRFCNNCGYSFFQNAENADKPRFLSLNKCTNCGQEFEGKFCPDCGTKREEEKTCPACNAILKESVRFCNNCGYSFFQNAENTDSTQFFTLNKCANCGQEFEGKFCPNCGVKWVEEKTCPVCGKILKGNTRFCNECGYSFFKSTKDTTPVFSEKSHLKNATPRITQYTYKQSSHIEPTDTTATSPKSPSILAKTYDLLKFLPAALFALFSVLLFLFYAAPVAIMPAQQFMGETIPAESYGNVYSMNSGILAEFADLKGTMITLILIAVFFVVFSATQLFVTLFPQTRNKPRLPQIFNYTSFALLLVVFITSCIACRKISSLDEGMGVVKAGSCLVLIIVFSLIFILLGLGSVVARYLIGKNYPEFLSKEQAAIVEEQEKALAQKQAAIDAKQHYYENHIPPVKPDSPTAPDFETPQPPVYDDFAIDIKKSKRFCFLNTLLLYLSLIIPLVFYVIFGNIFYNNSNLGQDLLQIITITLFFIGICIIILLSVLRKRLPVKRIDENKLLRRKNIIWSNVLLFPLLIPFKILIIIMLVHNFKTLKKIKTVKKQLAETGETLSNYSEQYDAYLEECKALKQRKKTFKKQNKEYSYRLCAYKHEKRRYDKAKEGKTPKAVIWLDFNKYKLLIVTTVLIIAIVLLSVLPSALANIFRIGKMEKIELGFTQEQVEAILGKPYEADSSDAKWVWYDENYLSVVEKLEKNSEQQEKALLKGNENDLLNLIAEEEKLLEQQNSMTYRAIEINFSKDSETAKYIVSNVLLDAAKRNSNASEKSVKNYSIHSGKMEYFALSCEITYRTYFSDGSYYSAYATATLANGETTDDFTKSSVKVTWSDHYHTEYVTAISMDQSGFAINNDALYLFDDSFTESDLSSTERQDITTVYLSKKATNINYTALKSCYSLKHIIVADDNPTYSSLDGVLYNKKQTELLYVPCAKNDKIVIPDGVTNIDKSIFDCYLLSDITVSKNNMTYSSLDGVLYNKKQTEIIYVPRTKNGEIVIPDGVTSIGDSAFCDCSSLTSIIIPDSVTSIGNYAFSRCSNLTSITIGNGIASIGWNAFSYNNLQYNEYDNAYYLGNYSNPYVVLVTAKSTHITTCIISENTKIIYESAFSDCDNLTSITIPDSVINIGSSSFDGCDNLTSVTIEDNVVSIDRTTFSGCYNLKYNEYDNAYYLGNENNPYVALITTKENITSCTINDNTKIICDKAFASSELTDIIIPDGVTSIGNYTFQWCENLTSVTIGNGITSIGSFAFDGCGSLTNIVIPDSVTSIGESAFLDCYSLSDITFNGTRAEWNNIKKGEDWNSGTNNRVVHCTDGDIKSN